MTVKNNISSKQSQTQGQGVYSQARRFRNLHLGKPSKMILSFLALSIAILLVLTPLVLQGNSSDELPVNVIYGLEENEETLGDPVYVETWDGRGTDSEECEKAGEGPRNAEDGWIHWVFSNKGDSTDARLVLDGTGSGTYEPGEPLNAEVWHFYTPYFELEGLEATVNLHGGEEGPGGGLVISDYCPGSEESAEPILTIVKEVLDADDNLLEENNVEFSFSISGGAFEDGEVFSFSAVEPKVFGPDNGLEFDVEYTVEEVEHGEYELVSITPSTVILTEEESKITVTIVNREEEPEEPEFGSLVIEKLLKRDAADEEVIPSTKVFTFNIYDNGTDDLVRENIEVEVINGEGSVLVENLPLGVYRVEEVAGEAYEAVLDPADGIVDLTESGNEPVTIEVTNTPRPVLIIEKVLLDADDEAVEDSDVQFTATLDGGDFDQFEVTFSVNEPAVLDHSDGLEFDVEYTLTEVEQDGYELASINPDQPFIITDENFEVTVVVINETVRDNGDNGEENGNDNGEEENGDDNGDENGTNGGGTTVTVSVQPEEPETEPEEEAEEEVQVAQEEPEVEPIIEEEVVLEPEEPATEPEEVEEVVLEPEEPQTEPEEEELVVAPEAPLATPETGGETQLTLAALGALLAAGGLILKKYSLK